MTKIWLFILCCSLSVSALGQLKTDKIDSLSTDTVKIHSAKKATLLSTALPGAGQIYNRKYWKAPVVWGGMGTCVYFISLNRGLFREYRNELFLRQSDPDHVSTLSFDGGVSVATDTQINDFMEQRKRWLDLSYFALVAVYGLNILDANVDGHLFDYNITPDISLKLNPSPIMIDASPRAGLNLTLTF